MTFTLLTITFAAPLSAHAQDAAILRARADSIAILARDVEARWRESRRADSIPLGQAPVFEPDQRLLVIEGVTVVVDSSLVEMAERAIRRVAQDMRAAYGRGISIRPREHWKLARLEVGDSNGRITKRYLSAGYLVTGITKNADEGMSVPVRNATELHELWRRRADALLRLGMDSAAFRWTGRLLGTGEKLEYLHQPVFRELAIGANPLAPLCFRRDLAACKKGLALEHEDRIGGAFFPNARVALLRLALESGGGGAYSRFMSDSTLSIGKRLEAAARVPVDTLVERWYKRTMESRPPAAVASFPAAMMALFWSSILCVISLRSSRWR